MFYLSAISLVVGASQSRRLNLGLILLLSAVVAVWTSLIGASAGHSLLHALRDGVMGTWLAELGLLFGMLLDRLAFCRDQ
jgi:hypothetical protein